MIASAHQNVATSTGTRSGLLAWAGWQLQVPADWQPLKLLGTAEKGWMIVGNSDCACFSIHWQHVQHAVTDGEGWARQRLKRLGLLPDDAPPAARCFDVCAWAHDVQTEEHKRTTHWFGYSASASLLLGLKVNGVLPKYEREVVTEQVLPSLCVSPSDTETRWAMYDLRFVTPAGFKLMDRHLYTGDIALKFRRGRGETLMLRQVYPGDLALERRCFERWLEAHPFNEHRRLKASSCTTAQWAHPVHANLTGICRSGTKRLAFPLGSVMPRLNRAVAAFDQALNRLLIAEYSTRGEPDDSVCEQAISGMTLSVSEAGHDA